MGSLPPGVLIRVRRIDSTTGFLKPDNSESMDRISALKEGQTYLTKHIEKLVETHDKFIGVVEKGLNDLTSLNLELVELERRSQALG